MDVGTKRIERIISQLRCRLRRRRWWWCCCDEQWARNFLLSGRLDYGRGHAVAVLSSFESGRQFHQRIKRLELLLLSYYTLPSSFSFCCHLISSPAVIRPVNAHSTDFSSSSFLFLGFPKRFSCIGKDVVIIPNESYSNLLFFLKFTAEISKFRK